MSASAQPGPARLPPDPQGHGRPGYPRPGVFRTGTRPDPHTSLSEDFQQCCRKHPAAVSTARGGSNPAVVGTDEKSRTATQDDRQHQIAREQIGEAKFRMDENPFEHQ